LGEVASWNWQKTLHYHVSLTELRRFEAKQSQKQASYSSSGSPSMPSTGVDSTDSSPVTPNVRRHGTVIST